MLLMTVVQRGVGFVRGIWFCRLLDDTVVGQWSMAFGFITMITPLMMLGLPGAMPRYVERYRMAGHLSTFLRRIVLGTLVGSLLVMSAMLFAPHEFGWLIFRESSSRMLVWSVALTVLTVLVFNFVNELVSSLRQVRVVSVMQFLQGVGFTIYGIGAIYMGGGLREVVLAYAFATIIATIPGWLVLVRNWSGVEVSDADFDSKQMWRSLLPYAAALWVMNLLTNTFELSDRYMILHLFNGSEDAARAAVGQYHSGKLIPTLLTSLATMFGGVLLPYLAADWEQGKTDAVQQRLSRVMFAMSAGFTACAAITLWMSPLLFSTLLEGRYSDGLAIQPMAFTFCIWAAIVTVAQSYLWVRERGSLVGWALAIGLAVNVVLNLLWLPPYGLAGAVAATMVSNGVVLVGIGLAMVRVGYQLDSSVWWVALLPLTLLAGWSIGLVASIGALMLHTPTREYLHEKFVVWQPRIPLLSRFAATAQEPA